MKGRTASSSRGAPTGSPTTSTSGSASRIPTSSARGCSTPRSCARTTAASTATAASGILDAPAPELTQGCCSYGAHFVDDDDVANVVKAFVRLRPDQMQFHAKARRGGFLRPGEPARTATPITVTRLVDDACIFLNRPGFAGGAGCALHIAALEAGERPLDWKPNVCWQVPLRLEHSTDENGHVTSRLREWKRRDWGEGGADFHWWCTESPEAFVGDGAGLPVASRDEIVELVGQRRSTTAGRAAGAARTGCRSPTRCLRVPRAASEWREPGVSRRGQSSSVSSSSNSTPYFSARAA